MNKRIVKYVFVCTVIIAAIALSSFLLFQSLETGQEGPHNEDPTGEDKDVQDPDFETEPGQPVDPNTQDPAQGGNLPENQRSIEIATYNGNKERVIFEKYHFQHVEILYDPDLSVMEFDEKVMFANQNKGLSFSVELVDESFRFEEHIEPQMRANGYELIATEPIVSGERYLFYHYHIYHQARYAIDIYVFEQSGQRLHVQFISPFEYEDTYVPRFEQMLASIQVTGPGAQHDHNTTQE